MSEPIVLAAESVTALAREIVAQQQAYARPEVTVAEAMSLTGHKSRAAFYRWTESRRVKPISFGRYRRDRLMRAMGAA